METVPPANISAHVGWRIQGATKESSMKPEQGYDTLTTTTITKVESTLDKLKDTCVVNNEKLEDITMLRRTPSNSNNV